MTPSFHAGDRVRMVEVPEGSFPCQLEALGQVGEIARQMVGGSYAVYFYHGCIAVPEDCLELVKGAS